MHFIPLDSVQCGDCLLYTSVDRITLTGGCAKNEGLKAAIEKVLKLKVIDLPVDPQLIGAIGAAEFARQKGGAA